jgi:hypothetical protein
VIGFNVVPCRYDAAVIREQGDELVYRAITRAVADFIAAVRENRRDEWLRHFYGELFPIEDASVVHDILTGHLGEYTLGLHQCERCGRIWLQDGSGDNRYHPYLPGTDEWRGALEVPAPGFVHYVAGQDFFGWRIGEVRQQGDTARVILHNADKAPREVVFTGVATAVVPPHTSGEPTVRFLSEWESVSPPLRRFVFDSTSQSYRVLLEVMAREIGFDG